MDRAGVRPFAIGVVVGIVCILGGRFLINTTSFADRLISPLWMDDTSGSADAIVVLGAGIVGPCEPNLNAVRRVMLAVSLWREGRAPIVFFTGGPPNGLSCPVATVMADLATQLGVGRQAIHAEIASKSTWENAEKSAPLLRALHVHRILVVTDRLHMPRASGVFEHFGFAVGRVSVPVYAGHMDNVSMLIAGAREYVALLYYRWKGWIGSLPIHAEWRVLDRNRRMAWARVR
jgi:uncharacterized SAM-binding protein YcdF (DUF218 family)